MVYMPFRNGEWWYCTQGQGGSFSHTGKLYWAFDFDQGVSNNSSSNPAYGASIYSPVNGTIVEVRDGLHDFTNNASSNSSNNYGWGNTIVIEDEGGEYYIRLAHLKYGSTAHLEVGDVVDQGDYVGRVGQTGHSTNPHLHMQVMESSMGASVPFTFVEGKLYSYEWIKSSLSPGMSVYDNNDEEALGTDFTYTNYYKLGIWNSYVHKDGAVGKNYRKHMVYGPTDGSYFKWYFRVPASGNYFIYASWPVSSNNETAAKYYLNNQLIATKNQTSNPTLFRYLAYRYLSKNQIHHIKVKGSTLGRYVIADAIGIKKAP